MGGLIAVGGGLTGAGLLVQRDVLPGRLALARALGQEGKPGSVPAVALGPIRRGSFVSAARGGIATKWVIAYPPDVQNGKGEDDADQQGDDGSAGASAGHGAGASAGRRLPVCIVLHGRGDEAESMVTLGYPNFLAAAVRAGLAPFALVSVDGGVAYWHDRRDGEDPRAMVLDELLPRLAGPTLATSDRIAFLGWSMGGYGALLLGSDLGPDRVAAIVAESPALWLKAGDTAAGAFDSPADYRAHDVFARRSVLSRIPIRIDCGIADPFHTAAVDFASGLHPRAVTDFGAGDHSGGYWRAKAAKAIEFIGNHLTSR